MEVDEIQTQGCHKFPRISNGNGRFDDGEVTKSGRDGRLCGWPTSRIVRVSRASGGKDRHSKVWTSKGLRDRRVRLSVNTAIQFYDLQDRLGYDQPSKAVEWLIKAAASSISDLPCLDPLFPENSTEDKRSSAGTDQHGSGGGVDSVEVEIEGNRHHHHQQSQKHLPRSACSSTSETSKGSGMSLSRSENRVKARERARERAAEKEKAESSKRMRRISQNSSFTELLTGGMSNNNNATPTGRGSETNFFSKSPFEYFPSTSAFQAQIHLGNPTQLPLSVSSPVFSTTGDHHPELHQQFPFVSDHLVPVAGGGTNGHANNISNDYNLNFSISSSSSSGLAGYNRGTLQSNSSSSLPSTLLPHFQRYDGSQSFFNGSVDDNHHHHFLSAYDARLQLFNRHSDQKGQGKN